MSDSTLTTAVFASGGGTNLQALLDHEAPDERWRVGLVVSDRSDAGALDRAHGSDIPTRVVATHERNTADVTRQTLDALRAHEVDLVLLAGYLRLVPAEVVRAFRGRMLNIHPALLPSFGGQGMYGIHVHRAVLQAGVRLTGPTVHLVDEVYDRGRILAQWPVPVHAGDSPEALARRVLVVEHRLYPRVVDHLARCVQEGRPVEPLSLEGEGFGPAAPDQPHPAAAELTDAG